jgi:hypothetical protein
MFKGIRRKRSVLINLPSGDVKEYSFFGTLKMSERHTDIETGMRYVAQLWELKRGGLLVYVGTELEGSNPTGTIHTVPALTQALFYLSCELPRTVNGYYPVVAERLAGRILANVSGMSRDQWETDD